MNIFFSLQYREIPKLKVELCPNAVELVSNIKLPDNGKIKRMYGIPPDAVIFI